ncbi:MAG: hypothetical protein ACQESP_09330 [Candidatus Muiribacteriota bacterium]
MKKTITLNILFLFFSFCYGQNFNFNNRIREEIEKRNTIAEYIDGYERINKFEIVDTKEVYYSGKLYGYAIETNVLPKSYFVFDKSLEVLLQFPYKVSDSYKNSDKDQGLINLSSFLYKPLPPFKKAYPLEQTGFFNEYAGSIQGINFENIVNISEENFFKLEGTAELRKNQRESKEAIDYLNKINKTNRFNYLNDLENPSFKCFFFAGAHTIDWKLIQADVNIKKNKYKNFLNHKKEFGTDPRFLDLAYRHFAKPGDDFFKVTSAFFLKDPVTSESVLYSVDGVAKLPEVFNKLPEKIHDRNVTQKIFSKQDYSYLKKFEPVRLFSTLDEVMEPYMFSAEYIDDALKKYGSLLGGIGLREFGAETFFSGHSVMVIGWIKLDNFLFLIYLDNYGDEAPVKIKPVTYFNSLYAFSTPLRADIQLNESSVRVKVQNIFNKNIIPDHIKSDFDYLTLSENEFQFKRIEKEYIVEIHKKYFYDINGEPLSIKIPAME